MPGNLQACSAGFPLVFLGVVGFVASVLALLFAWTARDNLARFAGPVTLTLGAMTLAVGLLASRHDLARAGQPQAAVSVNAAPMPSAPSGPPRCTLMAIQSGGMPLLAGLAATVLALVRARARRL